jgi:hypothetical protein
MSKFRKVAELENIPSLLSNSFIPEFSADEDPYAELRNNSRENQIRISKQLGFEKTAEVKENNWEKIQSATTYNETRALSFEERLAETGDFSINAIKRAGSSVDNGMNARTTTSGLQAFSADDYMNAMLSRSASIFNPDMIAISEEFMNTQSTQSEQSIADMQQKREATAGRHKSWEASKMKEIGSLRGSNVVSNRAHSVLRTNTVSEYNGSFGMINVDSLDQREAQRLANINSKREQKLALKMNKIEDFESRANMSAASINDIYSKINIDFDGDED